MNDRQIVELYFVRDEKAISETAVKYGRYCHYIANSILGDENYADEVVNDTYLKTWNSIPPNEPDPLKPYVGTISRNLALNRYTEMSAEKRGGSDMPFVYEELEECIPGNTVNIEENTALRDALNKFLATLPKRKRVVFVRRYWYASSISEIASDYSMTEAGVRMTLSRTRKNLKEFLEKEGIEA